MAADQTRNARRIIGKRHTDNSYNILYTFWELPHAPKSWRSDLDFFDELWTPNQFVSDAFHPIFPKRIVELLPCIDVDVQIAPQREKFGLAATHFYFLFYFDFGSFPERKNPLAVIKAFQAAFANGRGDIGLIIKSSGPRNLFPKIASQLEARRGQTREQAP
jgi:glycosyltransferase involved in cell wall biosynthesis